MSKKTDALTLIDVLHGTHQLHELDQVYSGPFAEPFMTPASFPFSNSGLSHSGLSHSGRCLPVPLDPLSIFALITGGHCLEESLEVEVEIDLEAMIDFFLSIARDITTIMVVQGTSLLS